MAPSEWLSGYGWLTVGSRGTFLSGVGFLGRPAMSSSLSPFSRVAASEDGALRRRNLAGTLIKPRLTSVLTNMTITATEMMTAITMPITTRGMAATLRFSINAISRPVHMTRVSAKYVASMSAPLVLCGLRNSRWAKIAHSTTKMDMTCTSPSAWAKAVNVAFTRMLTRNGMLVIYLSGR